MYHHSIKAIILASILGFIVGFICYFSYLLYLDNRIAHMPTVYVAEQFRSGTDKEIHQAKEQFLRLYGSFYGYNHTLDRIRKTQTPQLQGILDFLSAPLDFFIEYLRADLR